MLTLRTPLALRARLAWPSAVRPGALGGRGLGALPALPGRRLRTAPTRSPAWSFVASWSRRAARRGAGRRRDGWRPARRRRDGWQAQPCMASRARSSPPTGRVRRPPPRARRNSGWCRPRGSEPRRAAHWRLAWPQALDWPGPASTVLQPTARLGPGRRLTSAKAELGQCSANRHQWRPRQGRKRTSPRSCRRSRPSAKPVAQVASSRPAGGARGRHGHGRSPAPAPRRQLRSGPAAPGNGPPSGGGTSP